MREPQEIEPELITTTELARRLGVAESAVRKAVSVGRIYPAAITKKGRKLFDEETARKQWRANSLPAKNTGRTIPGGDGDEDKKLSVTKAKAMREAAQAEIHLLKIKQLKGELVNAEEVAFYWAEHVGAVRRLMLALPTEFRMLVPTLSNSDVELMEKRIAEVLTVLSNWRPGENSRPCMTQLK